MVRVPSTKNRPSACVSLFVQIRVINACLERKIIRRNKRNIGTRFERIWFEIPGTTQYPDISTRTHASFKQNEANSKRQIYKISQQKPKQKQQKQKQILNLKPKTWDNIYDIRITLMHVLVWTRLFTFVVSSYFVLFFDQRILAFYWHTRTNAHTQRSTIWNYYINRMHCTTLHGMALVLMQCKIRIQCTVLYSQHRISAVLFTSKCLCFTTSTTPSSATLDTLPTDDLSEILLRNSCSTQFIPFLNTIWIFNLNYLFLFCD